ncbi:NAD-dependent epimerase/dehydratase family protein [Microvirga tunisiensis]|uniref:NAD-dependent epimerase/dehydratase family protein n=1 Tax=Pannonibacter tanglangensis TaxID=2750084 RepID=A0A7X5F0F9_9HYPH|nr:NAD-dependent epimerase/dehydratase family protein [Pannonibacter sp. XCT-53]NBN77497.1 NAD-dependent epimerase/dehydratase family protein [Pannonibacter sp. XCT-53]
MADLLVTGINGFVGRHVSTGLARAGHRLSVLVRKAADLDRAAQLGARPVHADLTDLDRLASEAARADGVVHCAASDAPSFQPVNAAVVAAMLEALRPGAAFVCHAGSLVFGPTPNAAPGLDGSGAYAPPPGLESRAATDRMVREAGARRDLRTAVIHASFVYGGVGAALPAALTDAARLAGASLYPGDGAARWSTVHVEDWADLIVAAVAKVPAGGRAYVAGGPDRSMAEIATLLGAALGLPTKAVDPAEAMDRWGFLGPALSVPQVFDNRIARAEVGWAGPNDRLVSALAVPA